MTSIYTQYNSLGNYLQGQQFGPRPYIPVPPQGNPILPQNNVNYGINTLIHDSNNIGYYSIETGYGQPRQCTTFVVGSCPSNRPIQRYT